MVDAASGRELKRRRIGNLVSYTCDPHPQLRWVAWASPDGVAVGALDGQEKRRLWNGPWSGDIPFVEFSPDGRYLAVLGSTYYKRKLRIWETGTWKELPPLPVDPDINSTFHWSPDSRRVALSIPEQRQYPAGWFGLQPRYEMVNVPQVWDLASRRPHFDYSQLEEVRGHATRILELAWSPDGKRLISADEQGRLGTWDVDQGALLRFLEP